MSKHTPGPWRSGGCVVWQSNGDMVADLTGTVMLSRPRDEVIANAALITASPDLLAAARDALALSALLPPEARERIDALRAAIAKAEGRATP